MPGGYIWSLNLYRILWAADGEVNLRWLAAAQRESEPSGSSASFFVISQAVLWENPVRCSTGQACVERGSLLPVRTRTLEQKSNTVVENSGPLYITPPINKDINPHQSPASYMFTSASPVLGHERNPPCSLQLRLAHVTRERVSTVKHSCSAQKTATQSATWGGNCWAEREEGSKWADKHIHLSLFLCPVWAGTANILWIHVCHSDPVSQDDPIKAQLWLWRQRLIQCTKWKYALDNHPGYETWYYHKELHQFKQWDILWPKSKWCFHAFLGSVKQDTERILVIKGVPQSEEPRALLFGFTLSLSLGALLQKHAEKIMFILVVKIYLLCRKIWIQANMSLSG